MNILQKIYYHIATRISLKLWKLVERVNPEYFLIYEVVFMECRGCKREFSCTNEGDKICLACENRIMKTSCINCSRKIFLDTKKFIRHVDESYCIYCIDMIDTKTYNSLDHEIKTRFIKKEKAFEIKCIPNEEN